jgi:hypothetical protein
MEEDPSPSLPAVDAATTPPTADAIALAAIDKLILRASSSAAAAAADAFEAFERFGGAVEENGAAIFFIVALKDGKESFLGLFGRG